mgnify:CR=1 FL=1
MGCLWLTTLDTCAFFTHRTVGQYTSFTLVGTNRCIVVDYPSFHVRTCIAFQAQTLYVYAAVV